MAPSLFVKYGYNEETESFTGVEGGTASVVIDHTTGDATFDYENLEFELEIYRIVLKKGQGGNDVLGDHNVAQAGTLSIPASLSHVTFCLVAVDPFQIGPCDTETGTRDVTFTVPTNHNLTIKAVVGGDEQEPGTDFATGPHTVALESGTYNWYLWSPPGFGIQVAGGSFVVSECEKDTTTTADTTTTTVDDTTTTTVDDTTTTTVDDTTTTTVDDT
ncbi:MAG: hypothetical protein WD156_09985, partial [Acidimicrobiia bacterium]